MGSSGFGVRFLNVCSGNSCGKVVKKSAGKFVGKLWESFAQVVDFESFGGKLVTLKCFTRGCGKVLQKFCTAKIPCCERVLHNFHIAYYNYYYLDRVLEINWIRILSDSKNRTPKVLTV